jgi:hypothetical protein
MIGVFWSRLKIQSLLKNDRMISLYSLIRCMAKIILRIDGTTENTGKARRSVTESGSINATENPYGVHLIMAASISLRAGKAYGLPIEMDRMPSPSLLLTP